MDSKKIRVGVIFEGDLHSGGGFQYQKSFLYQIKSLNKFEFIIFTFSHTSKNYINSLDLGFKVILVHRNIIDLIKSCLLSTDIISFLVGKIKLVTHFEKLLEKENIDLVYFLTSSLWTISLVRHNYIITVWDLCHRDYPEFPEVSFNREFERREFLYTKTLKKAVAIIADSDTGKTNIIRRYEIEENRIYVVPYLPSVDVYNHKEVDIRTKYKIGKDYIFYPAQLWPHKNHVYIIEALAILKQMGIEIFAVFSGSDKGNLKNVLEFAKVTGVQNLVKYIGFAPEEDMFSLYKNALALVMPSFFGPTNIPPLEAFAVGTPVIYSELPCFREQVKDAALFCDLKNPMSLANHLINLKKDEKLRNILIEKGKQRLEELTKIKISKVLEEILDNYSIKLKCWKF